MPVLELHLTTILETNELQKLWKEIRSGRETTRKGGYRTRKLTGKVLMVQVFGVCSDMTVLELKRACNEVGLQ